MYWLQVETIAAALILTQHCGGVDVASQSSFLCPDIIDENLKIALQKELNIMAPGLTIQVFNCSYRWSAPCDNSSVCFSHNIVTLHKRCLTSPSHVSNQSTWLFCIYFPFCGIENDKGGPCHKAKDPWVHQEELWTHVCVKVYFHVFNVL